MHVLTGQATMPFSFLACLNKVQKELLHYPRRRRRWQRRRSQNVKVFTLKFLCDVQGTDSQAILSGKRSFLPPFSWGGGSTVNRKEFAPLGANSFI